MCQFSFEDLTGTISPMLWPDEFARITDGTSNTIANSEEGNNATSAVLTGFGSTAKTRWPTP
jgi:hypothetical protein